MMTQPTVFISYSHKDEAWKDRLVTHLGVLEKQGQLDLWDDRRIGAGEDWHAEIQDAMDRASVAVLLVSPGWPACRCGPKMGGPYRLGTSTRSTPTWRR
jgi:hypothetical protein